MKQKLIELTNSIWQWTKGLWPWYKSLYKGRPWYVKTLVGIVSMIAAFFIYLGAVDMNFLWLFGKSPSMTTIKNKRPNTASEIYSADGVMIGKFFSENRTPVSYEEVNPVFWKALIDSDSTPIMVSTIPPLQLLSRNISCIVMREVPLPSPSSWQRICSVPVRNTPQVC